MRKIPTLFVRDLERDYGRHVTGEVTPGCEWVLAGEGVPTRKFDGMCCMYDGARWWARCEVRDDRFPTAEFLFLEVDELTGKSVGWEPIEHSRLARWHAEAIAPATDGTWPSFQSGTYELIGPKINGNPEGWGFHALVRHGIVPLVNPDPITFETLRDALVRERFEGIVWHNPDGRMVKLKRLDFPAPRRDERAD
jgi:hypothetical protein